MMSKINKRFSYKNTFFINSLSSTQEKIYLSLDLDYWILRYESYWNSSRDFIEEILSLNLPVHLVEDHQELLQSIHTKSYTKIINIDYHSDLLDCRPETKPETKYLGCGNWVNFVAFREYSHYEWRYPNRRSCLRFDTGGYCHRPDNCDIFNPFLHKERCQWDKVSYIQGTKDIPWANIQGIGIAISPKWWWPYNIMPALELLLASTKTYGSGVDFLNKFFYIGQSQPF